MTKGTKILITILSILVVGGGATVGIVVLPQMFVKEGILAKFDLANDSLGQFYDLCEEEGISLDGWLTMAPDNFLGYDSYYQIVEPLYAYDIVSNYRTAAGNVKIEGDFRICNLPGSTANSWRYLGLEDIYNSDKDKFEYESKVKEESDEESGDDYKKGIYRIDQLVCFKSSKDYKEGRKKIKKYFDDISNYSWSYDERTVYIYDIGKITATIPYRVNPDEPLWNDDENVDGEVIVRETSLPVYKMVVVEDATEQEYYSDEYINRYVSIEYRMAVSDKLYSWASESDEIAKKVDSINKQLYADIPKDKVTVYKTVAEYEKKTGEKVKGISQEEVLKKQKMEQVYQLYKQHLDSDSLLSSDDAYYELVDIDNNGVPELFIADNNTWVSMLYIENGEVKGIGGKFISYHKGDGKIYVWSHPGGGCSAAFIYHFADGHMEKLFDGATEYSQEEERDIYTANEQEVSEEEYTRIFDSVWNYDSDIIDIGYEVPYDSLEEAKEAWLEQQ